MANSHILRFFLLAPVFNVDASAPDCEPRDDPRSRNDCYNCLKYHTGWKFIRNGYRWDMWEDRAQL